jgi:predicted RNA-binding protein with PIN domain
MLYVVDGFNLIYKFPELEAFMYEDRLKEAMNGLLGKLSRFQKEKSGNKFYVFFDGKKDKGNPVYQDEFDGMKIYYSHDLTADHIIKAFIRQHPSPGNLTIVSSDKKIKEYAKSHKCQIATSEEFHKLTEEASRPKSEAEDTKSHDPKLTDKEIRDWALLFKKGKPN